MTIYAHIIDASPVEIWGLTSRQRKTRVLEKAGITDVVDDLADLPEGSSVLIFRGDYLFDDRVITYLVQTPQTILKKSLGSTGVLVAAHVLSGQASEAYEAITKNAPSMSLADVKTETLESLMERRPTEAVRRAVNGMLPKNKLRKHRMKNLYIYEGSDHPHNAQLNK